jgi:hypothetical protein
MATKSINVSIPLDVLQSHLATDESLQKLVAEHVLSGLGAVSKRRGPKADKPASGKGSRGPRAKNEDGLTHSQAILTVMLSPDFKDSSVDDIVQGLESIDHAVPKTAVSTYLNKLKASNFIKSVPSGEGRSHVWNVQDRKACEAEVAKANEESAE